jgi:hypothetical protein
MHGVKKQISRGRLLRAKAAPLQSQGFALSYNESQVRC